MRHLCYYSVIIKTFLVSGEAKIRRLGLNSHDCGNDNDDVYTSLLLLKCSVGFVGIYLRVKRLTGLDDNMVGKTMYAECYHRPITCETLGAWRTHSPFLYSTGLSGVLNIEGYPSVF